MHTRRRRDDGVLGVRSNNKIEVGAFDAAVMTGAQQVITEVVGVLDYLVEARVGSIARYEKASAVCPNLTPWIRPLNDKRLWTALRLKPGAEFPGGKYSHAKAQSRQGDRPRAAPGSSCGSSSTRSAQRSEVPGATGWGADVGTRASRQYQHPQPDPCGLVGIIGGVLVTTLFVLTHRDPFFGWNAGFIGLGANLATTGLFALRSATKDPARLALRPA